MPSQAYVDYLNNIDTSTTTGVLHLYLAAVPHAMRYKALAMLMDGLNNQIKDHEYYQLSEKDYQVLTDNVLQVAGEINRLERAK